MGVTLRKKINSDGSISLYLDVYQNGRRHKEFLKDCKLQKPTTQEVRAKNKAVMQMAEDVAAKRQQELISLGYNIVATYKKDVPCLTYFEAYVKRYDKKDNRNMEGAYNRFKTFLKDRKQQNIPMSGMTEQMIMDFAEKLKKDSKGEGAASYFARFKKFMKYARRDKVIIDDPSEGVTIRRDEFLIKEVLTIEEIGLLAKTPISNPGVRAAFLFCCFTGQSWVDVKGLQWKHINLANVKLDKVREKSGQPTTMDLHPVALSLLPEQGKPTEFIFELPSHTGALKLLKNWVRAAGIQKHITWHCARHSFGTNLLYYKSDISTVSKLLGHASLKYVQRYTRIIDDMKKQAIDRLPGIDL